MGVELIKSIPTTEAAVVVPVPPGAVKLRIVFEVKVAMEVETKIPETWVPAVAAAAVLCSEFATVPPTKLLEMVDVTELLVFNLIP